MTDPALRARALAALEGVRDLTALAEWKSIYLGKQGAVTQALRGLGALPAAERPAAGQALNALRQELEACFSTVEQRLQREQIDRELVEDRIDVTLPGRDPQRGHVHPLNLTLQLIVSGFAEMGFQVWETPEVETDELNFTLLNMPEDHPARDMQDTFYVETPPGGPQVLLRTHTSPGQIRLMRRVAPAPLRVLLPGKTYRNEQVTARADMQFQQFEFLAVGRGISMAHLRGTLDGLAVRLFGPGTRTRLRPSYFPFTEPSAELDVTCFVCGAQGCRLCKYSGWLEIGGCGMVHPVVLRNGGYDPAVFSGFAGGFGVERIALLLYGLDDIRWFLSGDLRLIKQLG